MIYPYLNKDTIWFAGMIDIPENTSRACLHENRIKGCRIIVMEFIIPSTDSFD